MSTPIPMQTQSPSGTGDGEPPVMSPDIVLNGGDVTIVVLYFLAIFGISYWAARTSSDSESSSGESQQQGVGETSGEEVSSKPRATADAARYFSAENDVNWLGVSLSLFASNIGSEHFVGLAGTAAYSGFSIGWFELGAIPCLIALAFFFLPVYMRSKVATVPTYIELRYGKRTRIIVVSMTLLLYALTKISGSLLACMILLSELFPRSADPYVVTAVHIAASAAYTMVGGLKAVIYTESIQTVILLSGGFMVLACSMYAVGGFAGMLQKTQNLPGNETVFNLELFRPADDETQPWPAAITGYYAFAMWYWAVDQNIVQRTLAARNINHGVVACLIASVLKFLPFFLMIVPGVCGRLILASAVPDSKEEAQNVQTVLHDTDRIYAYLLKTIIPVGLRGFVLAGLLSALMSSLASVFNSSSTLFALNVWKAFRPQASDKTLVMVGRIVVVFMAIISVLWLPIMTMMGSHMFLIISAPSAFLVPPVTAIVFYGMCSSIPNKFGSEVTMVIGLILGMVRFILETVEVAAGQHTRGSVYGPFTGMHFMYFALMQFIIATVILFTASLIGKRCCAPRMLAGTLSKSNKRIKFDDLLWSRDIRKRLMDPKHDAPPAGVDDNAMNSSNAASVSTVFPGEPQVSSLSSAALAFPDAPSPAPGVVVVDTMERGDRCLVFTSSCPRLSLRKQRVETLIRILVVFITVFWLGLLIVLQSYGVASTHHEL